MRREDSRGVPKAVYDQDLPGESQMIERVPYYGWPKPTPTNAERVEAWRRKYQRVPVELQCAPIRKQDTNTPASAGKGATA